MSVALHVALSLGIVWGVPLAAGAAIRVWERRNGVAWEDRACDCEGCTADRAAARVARGA